MIEHIVSFDFGELKKHGIFKSRNEFLIAKNRYLEKMNETAEQSIYRLQKYCLVNWWSNPFEYLNSLLLTPELSKYQEFNFCGGRFGRKTYEISHFIAKRLALGMKFGKTTAIYGFRLYGADILELKKELVKALDDFGFIESKNKFKFEGGVYIYSNQNNTPYFRFADGSFIFLKGIYKSTDRAISLKGLASAQGRDLAIIWQEEANEFNNAETQAIRMAVRDARHRLYFNSSNPDELYQDYINYCQRNHQFKIEDLEKHGESFLKVYDPKTNFGKIFHYTNHRINPYLNRAEVSEFLELQKQDSHKYQIWGLGMPGGMEHSVFSQFMTASKREFPDNQFVAGIDLGYSSSAQGHPTRAVLSAVNLAGFKPRIHPIAEYYHSNAKMVKKNSEQINEEIIQFFINQASKHPQMRQGLNVKVDYGAGGLYIIDRLNAIARTKLDQVIYRPVGDWLHFEATDKKIWFIKDRIDITISLMSKGILTLNEAETPELWKEMKMIQWAKKRTLGADNTPKMVDLFDDGWDALMYSLMPITHLLMRDFKDNHLFKKNFEQLKKYSPEKADDLKW